MPARKDEFTTGDVTNRLRFMRGYLCGAMDRVSDGGETWRVGLQRDLADLQIFWLDPTHKPINIGIEDSKLRDEVRALKQQNLYDEVGPPVKIIRAVDLRMVDISDFLIVNLDLDVHACGTYEELFLANRQKKPVIVHVEQGKKNAPNWLFGTLPHEMIFSYWDEIKGYLRHVAKDSAIQHFNRWMFFNFDLCRKFDGAVE